MLPETKKTPILIHSPTKEILQHYEESYEANSYPPHVLNEQDDEFDFATPKTSYQSHHQGNKTHICDKTMSNVHQSFKSNKKNPQENMIPAMLKHSETSNRGTEIQKTSTVALDKRKIHMKSLILKSLKKLAKNKSRVRHTRKKDKNYLDKQDDATVETEETQEDSKRHRRNNSNISITPFAALDDDIADSFIEAAIASNATARELLEKERKEQHYYRENKLRRASMRPMKVLERDQEDPHKETKGTWDETASVKTEEIDWMNVIGFGTGFFSGQSQMYPIQEEVELNLCDIRLVKSASSLSSISSAGLSLPSDPSSLQSRYAENHTFHNVSQESNVQSENYKGELHSQNIGGMTLEYRPFNDGDNKNKGSIMHLADGTKQQSSGGIPKQVVVSGQKKHRRFFSLKKEELLKKNVFDVSHEKKEVVSNQEIMAKLSNRRLIKRYGSLSPGDKEFVKKVFNNEETKENDTN